MTGRRALVVAALVALGLLLVAAVARADLTFALSVGEGLTFMGGPLVYRMARPEPDAPEAVTPDAVTSASMDAVTSASRVASSGGAQLYIGPVGGRGGIVVGVEYAHYAFDLGYDQGRATMSLVALRILAMARFEALRFRRVSLMVGFGAYLELMLYDEALLRGGWVDLEVDPVAAGIVGDLRLYLWSFPVGRGVLRPGLYAAAYRGLTTQLRDELGSGAPLASMAAGAELSYEF